MEYRKRLFIWMTFSFLSTFALLSMIQHVDTAPMIRNVKSPKEISDSQGKRLFVPKYMIDLYSLIVDRYGNRRKGVSTIADKIKCFLPGINLLLKSLLYICHHSKLLILYDFSLFHQICSYCDFYPCH